MESELSKQRASSSGFCGYCERHFSNYNEFSVHYFRCPYTCVCQKEVRSECEYWQHFLVKKDSILHKCCICTQFFTQQVDLMKHIVRHADLVKYTCQHCEEEFSSFSTLASHASVSRVGSVNECYTCNDVFRSKCALVKHENLTHSGIIGSSIRKTFKRKAKDDQRSVTENPTSRDFSNTTTPEMNSCRTGSPNFVPDLHQHHEPHHLRKDRTKFSAVHPQDNSEHVDHPLPQQILLRYFHPDVIHAMKYNMSYHLNDCAYRRLQLDLAMDLARRCQQNLDQNDPLNLNRPQQHNGSYPWLRNSDHYMQGGSTPYSQSSQPVGNENHSTQNGTGSVLQSNEENLM